MSEEYDIALGFLLDELVATLDYIGLDGDAFRKPLSTAVGSVLQGNTPLIVEVIERGVHENEIDKEVLDAIQS